MYKENVKYPKRELKEITEWWQDHREYDVNEYKDYVEVVLRPNREEERLDRLRVERERTCFPVVNRGAVWYNRLTPEQQAELQAWYQAWLDVTKTGVMPKTPKWV